MKAFELRDGFGLDHLQLVDRPEPVPGPGEVLVRLRAASLNFRDHLVVEGKYNPRMALPRVPLSDGAGEVAATGEGVTSWKKGDRVVVPFMPAWIEGELDATKAASALGGDIDGMLREFCVVKAEALLPIPTHLSFEQAATLPCAAVTAWHGLFVAGALQPGETVLLQGTGGVSIFGLQFAKMAGAKVILLSSSDEKLERARSIGADELINYRQKPDWEKEVLERTDGRGVDLTLEVGGAGTLSKTLRSTRYAGKISLIGVLAGVAGEVQTGAILHKALTIRGIYVGSRAMFAAMNRAITDHQIEPVVDRIFPFEDSLSAFRHLASGSHFGKIAFAMNP